MLKLTEAPSDISRTNQLKIENAPEEVAEKLFLYLYKLDRGIDHFKWSAKDDYPKNDKKVAEAFFRKQHKDIKLEIQKRLAEYGQRTDLSDIQYFLSRTDGTSYVFFLSPNNSHSGWKQIFSDKWGSSHRERIFNLIFKFYILSQGIPIETINGFEELLLVHSKNLNETKDALLIWGQNLLVRYNYHGVLTLTISRKSLRFLPKDRYRILDGKVRWSRFFDKKEA